MIYINDLPSVIKFSSLVLFTDDAKLPQNIVVPTDQLCLQEDFNHATVQLGYQ